MKKELDPEAIKGVGGSREKKSWAPATALLVLSVPVFIYVAPCHRVAGGKA